MSARDDRIRAELEPLAPGERPPVVTVAALITAGLAVANGVLAATGQEVEDAGGAFLPVLGFVMVALAVGLWQVRYWAAIGFQALLTITAIYAFLSLLVASNLAAVVLSVALLACSGTLFWFLIRAMARMQAPSEG